MQTREAVNYWFLICFSSVHTARSWRCHGRRRASAAPWTCPPRAPEVPGGAALRKGARLKSQAPFGQVGAKSRRRARRAPWTCPPRAPEVSGGAALPASLRENTHHVELDHERQCRRWSTKRRHMETSRSSLVHHLASPPQHCPLDATTWM